MNADNAPVADDGWTNQTLGVGLASSSEAFEVILEPDLDPNKDEPCEYKKVERQRKALEAIEGLLYGSGSATPPPALKELLYMPLDHLPDWARRRYKVVAQGAGRASLTEANPFQSFIYLFNVLVALEWNPDQNDLLRLRWAFRRASNYLFDVTNGWMAFGQVVVGGPELMEAADIQIMASNRLHPRSWVGGMSDNARNMPIRTGRGLWHDRQQFAIPWEEPEAYRVLIHEWGHYALNLVDEYPSPPSEYRHNTVDFSIVIPQIMPGQETIMAGTSGVSELNSKQWERLNQSYAEISRRYEHHDGPQQLSDELPRFYLTQPQIQTGLAPTEVYFPSWRQDAYAELAALLTDAPTVGFSWIYLLRESKDAGSPRRIIAQGALDARWKRADAGYLGMRLLDARDGDKVMLINSRPGVSPQILEGGVYASEGKLRVGGWRSVSFGPLPLIEVIPERETDQNHTVPVRVRVSSEGVAAVAIFPFGYAEQPLTRDASLSTDKLWISEAVRITTLDGHILARVGEQTVLSSFSQGGGPPFHTPGPANPITGGSSDGTAMLFFYSDLLAKDDQSTAAQDTADLYSKTKIVTTLIHTTGPALPNGLQAGSYAFSIASNAQLPRELCPTLVLYYDLLGEKRLEQGDVRFQVCRLVDNVWQPQETSVAPFGSSFAALPLYTVRGPHPGGTLVADGDNGAAPRVETYIVCWQA